MRAARYPSCGAGATEAGWTGEWARIGREGPRPGPGVPGGRANVARMSAIGPSDVAYVAALARLGFAARGFRALNRNIVFLPTFLPATCTSIYATRETGFPKNC